MQSWIEKEVDESQVAGMVAAGVAPLIARLLALRGVSAGTIGRYFEPNWRDLAQPKDLPGVDEAAAIILDALEAGEKIAVFGDYDCDGVCATAIMAIALRAVLKDISPAGDNLEGRVVTFLPERLTEGYGLTDASVARLVSEHPDVRLVVTVDNGVNAVEQIDSLSGRGIRVVVTDHHLRGEELPRSAALVNPKVAAPENLSDLCGAAVAYFLSNAVVALARERRGDDTIARGIGAPLFVMAGLATVTDIMPLRDQNRIFVAESLKHFVRWAPVGLRELHMRASRTAAEAMTSRDFGFVLGPRINAVGRLGSSEDALKLLMCPECDRERSRALAMEIDFCNASRRSVEQRMTEAALEQIRPGSHAQVIAFGQDNPDVHPGVSGIVASRLVEKLVPPVPVCVLVNGKGSSRAPAGYNVREALADCADLLTQYGGHAAAAGLAVKPGEIDRFRAKFAEACAAQAGNIEAPAPGTRLVDAFIEPRDVTVGLAEQIARMEPFGESNPEPVFAIRRVTFAPGGIRTVGAKAQHLQFEFGERGLPRALWWNRGDMLEELRARSNLAYSIAFTIAISDYGGKHVELSILDMREAKQQVP